MESSKENEDCEDFQCTPPEIREAAQLATLDLLPEKSKGLYELAYKKFSTWKSKNKAITSENCIIAYLKEMMKTSKPPTLWSQYSMLKSTIAIYEGIQIKEYKSLYALLSNFSRGYHGKKANIFSAEDVQKFLQNAPDEIYLATKVVLIFGISGCYRKNEIYKVKIQDIKKQGELFQVRIPETKTNKPRSFTINSEFVPIVDKYLALRPKNAPRENFFLNFQKGRCTIQVIGINKIAKMPSEIAKFLNLTEPETYTGHSFRRTSATLFADSGANILELQRFGGWESATVAQGYVDESLGYKKKSADRISNMINFDSENTEKNKQIPPTSKEESKIVVSHSSKSSSPEKVMVLNNCNVTINYSR